MGPYFFCVEIMFFYFAPSVIPLVYTPSVVPLLWYPLHIPPYRAAPLYMGLYDHIIIYNIIIVLPLESIFEFVFIAIHKEIWYTPALHQFVFFFMKIEKK